MGRVSELIKFGMCCSTVFQHFMNLFLSHICYAFYVATTSSQEIQKVAKESIRNRCLGLVPAKLAMHNQFERKKKKHLTELHVFDCRSGRSSQLREIQFSVCLFAFRESLALPQLLRVSGQTIILRIAEQQEGPRRAESTSASV